MVTTVEPGIYIAASGAVARRWRNIGVRIEDDVAIANDGPDVLSKDLAKEPDDIERQMAG
jgi:Xaa-Pro aminopeptidase